MTADTLRREVLRQSKGTRSRYTADLRERVVAEAFKLVAKGTSLTRAAEELGVSQPTLIRWVRDAEPKLRAVEIVPLPGNGEVSDRGLRLKTPAGYVVEGLDPHTLVALLRTLG